MPDYYYSAYYYEMYVAGPQGTAVLTWYNQDGSVAESSTKANNPGTATLHHALSAAPTSRDPGVSMTFTLTNPNSNAGGYVPTTWTLTDLAGQKSPAAASICTTVTQPCRAYRFVALN